MDRHGGFLKNIWKIVVIIPIAFLFNVNLLITKGGIDLSVQEMLAGCLFGAAETGDIKTYALVLEKSYYILIFNMIFGTYIYNDFLVSSIYLFSRLRDRKKWFNNKVVELVGFALTYTFLFLSILFIICAVSSNYQVDKSTFQMLGILWLLVTLFLTVTTLIINLIAIKFNSSVGFICVYIALLILIAHALQFHDLSLTDMGTYLMLVNPVYAIIFNMADNVVMRMIAIIYYLILNGIVILLGTKYINNLEVGLLDKESDG